jgi:predicted dithiol-disulfide oxidoreductase (DUF899 family)
MTSHMTGTREEWLAARLELLKAEKGRSPACLWSNAPAQPG